VIYAEIPTELYLTYASESKSHDIKVCTS